MKIPMCEKHSPIVSLKLYSNTTIYIQIYGKKNLEVKMVGEVRNYLDKVKKTPRSLE